MKALALALAIVIGLLFSAAISEADDEPPDTCSNIHPHCEEPWTQRPPVP